MWRGVYFGRGLQRSPWRECGGRNPGLPRTLRPSLPTGTLAPSLMMPMGWLWVPLIVSSSSELALSRRGFHGSPHFLFLVVFGVPTHTLSRCWGHRRASALRCGVRLGCWGAGDGGWSLPSRSCLPQVAPHAQDSGLVLSLEPGGPGHRDTGSSLRRFSGSLDNSPRTLFFPPPGMQALVDG